LKGEALDANKGIRKSYGHRLESIDRDKAQRATVVMSTIPRAQLPKSMKRPGAQKVCEIEYVVPAHHMMLMKGKWNHAFNAKPEYYYAEYEVRAIIATRLKFEIRDAAGMEVSKAHEEIEVMWELTRGRGRSSREET
jgi:hypothetical protein